MGRGVHTHLKVGEEPSRFSDDEGKMQSVALCGEDAFFHYYTGDIARVNCPACSQKWGRQEAKARGAKFTLERVEKVPYGVRSRYIFRIDGVQYALLERETGKYGRWHALTMENASLIPNDIERKFSKEHAALFAWDAYVAGKLKTQAEVDALRDARQKVWRDKEAERKLKEQALEDEFNETLANLIEARDTAQTKLSNAEVAAVSDAISLLQKIKDTPRLYNRVTSLDED